MDCRGARLARERHLPAQRRLSAAAAGLRCSGLQTGSVDPLEVEEGQSHTGYVNAAILDASEGWNCITRIAQFFDAHLVNEACGRPLSEVQINICLFTTP